MSHSYGSINWVKGGGRLTYKKEDRKELGSL